MPERGAGKKRIAREGAARERAKDPKGSKKARLQKSSGIGREPGGGKPPKGERELRTGRPVRLPASAALEAAPGTGGSVRSEFSDTLIVRVTEAQRAFLRKAGGAKWLRRVLDAAGALEEGR